MNNFVCVVYIGCFVQNVLIVTIDNSAADELLWSADQICEKCQLYRMVALYVDILPMRRLNRTAKNWVKCAVQPKHSNANILEF